MKIKEIKEELRLLQEFNPKSDYPETLNFNFGMQEEHIEYAKKLGLFLCAYRIDIKNGKEFISNKNALTNSQIRNVFGEVKRIQMKLHGTDKKDEIWSKEKSSVLLLKPKLAYAKGRVSMKNKNSKIIEFVEVLTISIDKIQADSEGAPLRFLNFTNFFEAILAYHKAYGGKE